MAIVWKVVITGALAMHGLGHFLFAAPLWGVAGKWRQSTRSWLLGGGSRSVGGIAFALLIVSFVAAAGGFYSAVEWWKGVAIYSALGSAVMLVLFWTTPIPNGVIPAMLFNLVILGALLVFRWPN